MPSAKENKSEVRLRSRVKCTPFKVTFLKRCQDRASLYLREYAYTSISAFKISVTIILFWGHTGMISSHKLNISTLQTFYFSLSETLHFTPE